MSLRALIRTERLRLQLALNEAKGAQGAPRGLLGSLGGMGRLGLRENMGSRLLAPRGANPSMQGQPNSPMPMGQPFQPKTPILKLFMGGSRPLRELAGNLLQSTQQPSEQETPEPNLDPQIVLCPMCNAQVLETFEFCPSCAHILKASTGQESSTLSVQA